MKNEAVGLGGAWGHPSVKPAQIERPWCGDRMQARTTSAGAAYERGVTPLCDGRTSAVRRGAQCR